MDVVHGIRAQGDRMKGADGSTELRWQPNLHYHDKSKILRDESKFAQKWQLALMMVYT